MAKRASFAAVAEQLGMSAAFISKRVRLLEQQMGVRLLHRTTRRVSLSEEGERVYQWALQIFETVQRMGDDISTQHRVPVGQLRIASSLGLGRRFVAPALSELAERYPQLDIRLDVHDRLVDLIEEGVDLDIRVGNVIAPHLIAKPLAPNRRVLCAAPGYLQRRGTPRQLAELSSHDCLVIKERDHPFGVWQLQGPQGEQSVRVTGGLSTNHGEVAHQWCLDGRGYCCVRTGMCTTAWPMAGWCRCWRTITRRRTSGRYTPRPWPARRKYAWRSSSCASTSPSATACRRWVSPWRARSS